ncbi:MAG: hypothetical protein DI551_11345 [Micavibrio aeruginosavorus]|uniref:Uncharacterized protein n=1 Tax=Micavibrio aeruginosavorus TaxID=349221 RepID=A0A2W5MRD5_9BACT|nr:MAG: hypothetical protein DI551_11345 [Micavibrio aeruginosavorus]
MKKIFLCLALLLTSVPAYAQLEVPVTVEGQRGRTCYTPAEAEAEQGIRIHSELMVIALNCQHMTPRGWTNFYVQYQQITARNANLIGGYENTLINYFALAGRPNPERAFHDLRTSFANKVSTDAAQMRPDIFCATYAPRLPKVDKMSTAELKAWASDINASHPVSHPMCAGGR